MLVHDAKYIGKHRPIQNREHSAILKKTLFIIHIHTFHSNLFYLHCNNV